MAYDDKRELLAEAIARRSESEKGRYSALRDRDTRANQNEYLSEARKGWGDPALQGAAIGTAVAPGLGTLLGGIGGSVLGGISNFSNYRKGGQGFGSALWNTLANAPGTVPSMGGATAAAPGMISGFRGMGGSTLPESPAGAYENLAEPFSGGPQSMGDESFGSQLQGPGFMPAFSNPEQEDFQLKSRLWNKDEGGIFGGDF